MPAGQPAPLDPGAALANGLNIPYAAYLDLVGRPIGQMTPTVAPVLWVDRVNDTRGARAAMQAGGLPADGVVRNVCERDDRKVIDISMNFYAVHVQRVPLAGTLPSVEENGRRVVAGSDDGP
ncbi:hypothetical protein [Candidatus Thiodictyon syntrophicum]|uniref:Uncharacterized protein n=1 Tax=Candidatus Thiodictyon syntrophicum TaxID=1166950 RepID=A0A2K8UAF7_9GAMM|nr:hypothetical protein [Candidatus Thiodictyon syntrophicum]AUB82517.1 hypothetical protein THSYN_17250 [Candidatus Thiodictyon syntrophicum]